MGEATGDNSGGLLLPGAAELPPPGMVGAGKLAKALGVTRMTITNYVRDGMPHTVASGQRWFDQAACVAWAKTNKAHAVEASTAHHGGIRGGAGRKAGLNVRGVRRASGVAGSVAGRVNGRGGGRGRSTAAGEPGQAFDQSPLGQAVREAAMEAAEQGEGLSLMRILNGRSISDPGVLNEVIGRVTRADAENLRALIEASSKDMAMKAKRGELVDRAAAAAAMQEVITGLVHAIDGLPQRLADLAQIGLPPVAGDRGQSAEPMDPMSVARLRAAAERLVLEIRQRAAAALQERSGTGAAAGGAAVMADAATEQEAA
ncbi:MAG: hypothetical protein ACK5MB_00060 [Phycisphaerales bacterium]|jgi:hypothetical protein